ncbi:MAG: hypothetical protein K5978_04840 [Campylobacter sp.]|nr:hypothetical protein [Campylobacter sp.]
MLKFLLINLRSHREVLPVDDIALHLKKLYPNAKIDLLASQDCKADPKNFDETFTFDSTGAKFLKRFFCEFKMILKLKKHKYNCALITQASNKAAVIAKSAKIKHIIGFESNDETANRLLTYKIKSLDFDHLDSVLTALNFREV